MDLDRKAQELKNAGTPFCWATVVRARGSAPRGVGAKMIVTGEASFGTVGGGGVEHRATDEARELLRSRRAETRRYDLTEEGGIQPCGGEVEIFFEPVQPPRPLVLFGAGHVGEALCPLLIELGFEVTAVDERPERLELPAFARARRICDHPEAALKQIPFSPELHIICMTHRHTHDEMIVERCLAKPFAYLGLISSRKKWALFCEHYRTKGLVEEAFGRVSTPIGLDIGAETPLEIAVAVAAQLIQLHAKPEDFKLKSRECG